MRTRNTIINSCAGAVSYLVLMVSNFVVRAVFVKQLGEDVLGVNALFTNIISMLALAELGLGTGLIYKLYLPVAQRDVPRIESLLRFYKRAYMIIGTVIALGGFGLSFFVYVFDKYKVFTPAYLGRTFFLFVIDVLVSYLFAHQKALITADQKNYIINLVHAGAQAATCVLQIVLLILTKSFVLYIVAKIVCRLAEAFVISRQYHRLYPDITVGRGVPLDRGERGDLFRNINAMLYHKIGSFSLSSTSNMIITYFVNLGVGGIYSNYTLITNTINNLIAQLFQGATASFGDLLNTERIAKAYDRFNTLYYINFLLVSFSATSLGALMEPFITQWVGERYVMSRTTLILTVIYFYIYGMRRVIFMARDSAGLYRPDKYMPLVEACINLGLAFLLVKPLGVNGVLIANIVSMLIIPFWIQPLIVYKDIFSRSVAAYFGRYACYFASTIAGGGLTLLLCSRIPFGQSTPQTLLALLLRGLLCLIVPNTMNLLLFCRTSECRYTLQLLSSLRRRLSARKK